MKSISLCHCMTGFGRAVLFDFVRENEATASLKTPKQWHKRERAELSGLFQNQAGIVSTEAERI